LRRPIVGFHLDDEDHWVADLSCGHAQHVRHDPPARMRPWVLTEEGRSGRLGEALDCRLCETVVWPDGLEPYKRTPTFSAESVPAGLLANHQTKAGVWARIHVEQGRLEYVREEPEAATEILDPGGFGTVLPEARHRVRPLGPVSFHVEFWRRPRK